MSKLNGDLRHKFVTWILTYENSFIAPSEKSYLDFIGKREVLERIGDYEFCSVEWKGNWHLYVVKRIRITSSAKSVQRVDWEKYKTKVEARANLEKLKLNLLADKI